MLVPRVLVTERDSNQSHLRMSYRPKIEVTDAGQRAALAIYSTLLGGSMDPGCSTRSASSVAWPTRSAPFPTPTPTFRSCS